MANPPAWRTATVDDCEGYAAAGLQASLSASTLYTVTSNSDADTGTTTSGTLRHGAGLGDRWIIFDASYTIAQASDLVIASDTVIDGRGGVDIQLTGRGIYTHGSIPTQRAILTHITIRDIVGNNDAVRVWESATDIWIDHCTLHDIGDGHIDVTQGPPTGAMNVTISNNRFDFGTVQTNELTILLGDEIDSNDDNIYVSLYRNYYNVTRQRHPLTAIAQCHSWNNYIEWQLYGMQSRDTGDFTPHMLSENDIFDATSAQTEPNAGDGTVAGTGTVVAVTGALLQSGGPWSAGVNELNPGSIFTPPYSYTLASTTGLETDLAANSGRVAYAEPPDPPIQSGYAGVLVGA